MGGDIGLPGLAPVEQVAAEALAAHSGGQVLNLLPRYALAAVAGAGGRVPGILGVSG